MLEDYIKSETLLKGCWCLTFVGHFRYQKKIIQSVRKSKVMHFYYFFIKYHLIFISNISFNIAKQLKAIQEQVSDCQ